jgi:hypothetical protein
MDRVDALADALSRALQRLLRLRGPVGDAEVVPLLRVVLARRGTAEKLLEEIIGCVSFVIHWRFSCGRSRGRGSMRPWRIARKCE